MHRSCVYLTDKGSATLRYKVLAKFIQLAGQWRNPGSKPGSPLQSFWLGRVSRNFFIKRLAWLVKFVLEDGSNIFRRAQRRDWSVDYFSIKMSSA